MSVFRNEAFNSPDLSSFVLSELKNLHVPNKSSQTVVMLFMASPRARYEVPTIASTT
jgi:hypothetical protein